ncbi:MAG: saccharopine dehydrogenase NADP-binding domain-containing protein [Myxococcota bacterium]
MKRIAVFGATGHAGRLICQLLLESEAFEILACSRTPEKLVKLQTLLDPSGSRLSTRAADLHRAADVDHVLGRVDMVVGATSQWQDAPALAARAAESSTHFCGIYLSNQEKWQGLRELHETCVERGVMVIDDCGTHPGLPGVMMRRMNECTPLRAAWVGAKFDLEWDALSLSDQTISDFMSEIEMADPSVFTEGHWERGYSLTRQFDFGRGPVACTPMLMEEIREVVKTESLDSAGFYIGGFGPFVDYVVIPASIALSKINRRMSRTLLWWGLRRHASRTGVAVVQLEGERADGGGSVKMTVSHPDPYFATAVPVVATIRQALETPKPGVWTQAAFVAPGPFFDRIREMGLQVSSRPELRTHAEL